MVLKVVVHFVDERLSRRLGEGIRSKKLVNDGVRCHDEMFLVCFSAMIIHYWDFTGHRNRFVTDSSLP